MLSRFLERGDRHVYALVRADDDDEAAERLPAHERLTAVAGDIERRGLGLADARRASACAARSRRSSTARRRCRSTLPLEESRRVNVEGTRRMVEFARALRATARALHLRLDRLRGGRARRPLPRGRARRRPELPQPLRALEVRGRAGAARARPRTCRSRSCARASSSATAAPAAPPRSTCSTGRCRAFARGAIPAIPARRDVAGGHRARRLRGRPVARARHERAGRDLPPRGGPQRDDGRAAARAVVATELRPPEPAVLPPRAVPPLGAPAALRRPQAREALRRMEVYFPYFSMRVRFDDRRLGAGAAGGGLLPPPARATPSAPAGGAAGRAR